MPWMIFESQVVMLFFPPRCFNAIIRINAHCFAEMEKLHGWPSTIPIRSTLENWTAIAAQKVTGRWIFFFDDFPDFEFFGRILSVQKPAVHFPGVYGMGIVATIDWAMARSVQSTRTKGATTKTPWQVALLANRALACFKLEVRILGEGLGWWCSDLSGVVSIFTHPKTIRVAW